MRYLRNIGIIICILICSFITNVDGQTKEYKIDFFGNPIFQGKDTVLLRFNLRDLYGNKIEKNYDSSILNKDDVTARDTVLEGSSKRRLPDPIYNVGSFKFIQNTYPSADELTESPSQVKKSFSSSEITVSILVDRSGSMTESKINTVNEVVADLLKQMPANSVFLSSFNNDISPSFPISINTINEHKIKPPADPANSHTALYNSIYTKLMEFDNTSIILNMKYESLYFKNQELSSRNTPNNYLIVLTDGKDESENIPKYANDDFIKISLPELLTTIQEFNKKKKVEIWMIGIRVKDDKTFDEETMKKICESAGNSNNYRLGGEEQLPEIFQEVIQIILPDYELSLNYPDNARFVGLSREVKLNINLPDSAVAKGVLAYKKGSPPNPFELVQTSKFEIFAIGLLLGIIILLIVFVILQILIPLIKSLMFKTTYVKKYKPQADVEKLACSWCKGEILSGENAVFCCEHVSHWKCWKENGHQCPNHPDLCESGKQDYFDIRNIFGQGGSDSIISRNKKKLWRWIFWGIVGAMLTWILYFFFVDLRLSEGLINWLVPKDVSNKGYFVDRYDGLLFLGLLLGFFLSSGFFFLEEFRRLNFYVTLRLLLRSLIGAVIGFITFFVGCLALILIGKELPTIIDIIVWIPFGLGFGYYLSVKTTLSARHGILGGLGSIIICFVMLYILPRVISMSYENAMAVGLSLYGAGLGLSISVIRQRAEKYFLILSNAPVKNTEFPLHKWISRSADYGIFTIGRGNKNIIKMDWEKEGKVSNDVHAAIYLEKSGKEYTVISIRDTENKSYLNEHILMRPEREYMLHSGDTFNIGNTKFKYEEKQH